MAAYTKQTWDTTSIFNPTRMNYIEQGIYDASTNIADNLATNDATTALSAKQGKVLNDMLNNVVTVNGNPDYINGVDKYIYYVKIGRLVVFSGRFSITTEKPSGQGAYLFTNLPEPIALTSVNETTRNDIILVASNNKGWITSNSAIQTGNYNVFGAYISKN